MAEAGEYDYEKIVKALVEKNLHVGHLEDEKIMEEVQYVNAREQYLTTKAELQQEQRLNEKLDKDLAELTKVLQKVVEDENFYKNRSAEIEKELQELENEREIQFNNFFEKTEKLISNFANIDKVYNSEYLNNETKTLMERNLCVMERINTKREELIQLKVQYDSINIEIPNFHGVFEGIVDVKETDLEVLRKKMVDLNNKYDELENKMNNL